MTNQDDNAENFWDLLADIARLQAKLSEDFRAWEQANEANARAFQRNAETLQLMAEIGRRTEKAMRRGPSAAARLVLQLFGNPMQAAGAPPGSAGEEPFARFWDAWRAAAESFNPTDDERTR